MVFEFVNGEGIPFRRSLTEACVIRIEKNCISAYYGQKYGFRGSENAIEAIPILIMSSSVGLFVKVSRCIMLGLKDEFSLGTWSATF